MNFLFLAFLFGVACVWALPSPPTTTVDKRADTNLAGYLGVFFLGDKPDVYFYLNEGNNAFSMKALNAGKPVLVPTLGVRDPSIISGGGAEAGKKWYIIGTDLNIAKTTWDAAQRQGSKGIFVWESTDMINWTSERLVQVETSQAGMTWAPDAIWDDSKGMYLVHWATKLYSTSDPTHKSSPSPDQIHYSHTSDFRTFTAPQTFISFPNYSIIDLCILPLPSTTSNQTYARFLKNETATNVFMEISSTGLFGTWNRPGGKDSFVRSGVEGPYAWMDNVVPGKVNLLLDYFGGDGYKGFTGSLNGSGLSNGVWMDAAGSGWPKGLRHGSVVGIGEGVSEGLRKKWG